MIGRVIGFALLFVLGCVGLGMSLCGGFFLLSPLLGGTGDLAGIWVIAGIALGLGLAALWGASKGFKAMRKGEGRSDGEAGR